MSTPSERLSVQLWFESQLGCKQLEHWSSYKAKLEGFALDPAVVSVIRAQMSKDVGSLYERALISFSSAFSSLRHGYLGWAHVKLYYSTYYATRAILTARGHCLVRNQCWYHAFLPNNPATLAKLNSSKYRNDHDTALNLYIDYYKNSDWIISNNIDGLESLTWLMELRNDSNYRYARFSDPIWLREFKPEISKELVDSIDRLCVSILADGTKASYFDPERAWIAIPLAQITAAAQLMAKDSIAWTVSSDRASHFAAIAAEIPASIRAQLLEPSITGNA